MRRRRLPAFTLVELLVAISVISVLVTLVMPGLSRARAAARTIQCLNNLRHLGAAWTLYADEHRGYCMPQVWFFHSPPLYWWGTNGNPANYQAGLLFPYLDVEAGLDNVFDCPEQPWGSYIPQGAARGPTTTYGYNGLYLAPLASGWFVTSPNAPWLSIEEIESPSLVFVFADTALDWSNQGHMSNNCYIDGPQTPWGNRWAANSSPTLRFRHRNRACIFFADSHVDTVHNTRATITSTVSNIGYVGQNPGPHYVPTWQKWF